MPIEFRCMSCDKLLRTPDETAGRQAKCPACGVVMTVPEATGSPAGSASGGESPFGTFYDDRPRDSVNPYEAPDEIPAGDSPFGASLSPSGIRPTRIGFGDVLARTWTVFTEKWGMCLAVALVCVIINFGVGQVSQIICQLLIMAAGPVGIFGAIVVYVATQVFGLWINTGQAIFFVKTARGHDAEFTDIFTGGPYLLRVLGAGILFSLGGAAILGICLAPAGALALAKAEDAAIIAMICGFSVGFIAFIAYTLTFLPYFYLIIDQNMGIIDSLTEARRVTSGNRLTAFGILLVTGLIGGVITLFTCGIGLLAVLPYMSLLYVVLYLSMIGQPTAGRFADNPI
ncbi:MAG: hypothetical protein GX621_02600 [Pirellulaceae bacterium]|nr:hypothetical protein [Pirellulaceae bacterium]